MKSHAAQQISQQVRADYNAIAPHFAQTRQLQWYEVQYLVEQYVHPGSVVLDLGCGNGRIADVVNQIKGRYIGMDISEELIAIARAQHPGNEFYVGDMLATGFLDHSFDVVFLIASLHQVPSDNMRLRALQEVRRITKPGGMIILLNWNLYQWRFVPLRWWYAFKKIVGVHSMDWGDVLVPWKNPDKKIIARRYYHAFKKRELRRLCKRTGLRVTKQYYERNGLHVPQRRGYNLVTIVETERSS